MCLPLMELCGGGPPRGPHSRPGGPPWGPGGSYERPGNPVADCICCPCNLLCYILYACQEISYCFCGIFNCCGYDRYESRGGYHDQRGPPPPYQDHHQHHRY
ncbi:hypothetical protein Mapa_002085 [Marchantia paleacea]|nr:hypothetical protein Mapa_002085 [Marchantia paleacea]